MADLKQAIMWMMEGRSVRHPSWKNEDAYIHFHNGRFESESGIGYIVDSLDAHDNWELYIHKPEYHPDEVALNNRLTDMEDYVVWDKNGRRTFAYWSSEEQSFFDIHVGFGFALDVVEWAPIPEPKGKGKVDDVD